MYEKCKKCEQKSGKCFICDQHLYGEHCESSCDNCKLEGEDDNCDIITGDCTTCVNNTFFGSGCKEKCDGCENGCDKNGYCNSFKCLDGKYSLKCDKSCECTTDPQLKDQKENSCGKFNHQCLNCDFGYYGSNCSNQCSYKCKSHACCIFRGLTNEEKEKQLLITTKFNLITLNINNKSMNFEIDYSNGYQLTIFGKNSSNDSCNENIETEDYENMILADDSLIQEFFTNYELVGKKYNTTINLFNFKTGEKLSKINDSNISIQVYITKTIKCLKNSTNKINGVIGLGFLNQFTLMLLEKGIIYQHILSYTFKGDDNISLLFGRINETELENFDKLSYCDLLLPENIGIAQKDLTCKLSGLYFSKYSDGYEIPNSNVTFSLTQDTEIVLGKLNETYTASQFFNAIYFQNNLNSYEDNGVNKTYYFSGKINNLQNIGFVIENHVYSYKPDLFFEKQEENKYRFKIKFNDEANGHYIRIGKDLLKNTVITINNEEGRVYFYTKDQMFFNKELKKDYTNKNKGEMTPMEMGFIVISIIVVFNIILFLFYYKHKTKKMKDPNYVQTI